MGFIEGNNRDQIILESLNDYISEDNPVRVIDAYVDQLEMKELGFIRADRPTKGRPPYNPQDLLKLYIYGYLNNVRSSRKLEDETNRNIEVMWLLKRLKPDFKTIADFRKDNKKALEKVFRDFNRLCDEWSLYGKELVAVDGSKFKAYNSKKNNYNKKKLKKHLKYIDDKISKYMQAFDEKDKIESCDRKPNAKEIGEKINKLKERKKKYEEYQKYLEETGKNEISTTDPDARLMSNNNNGLDVSYNVQTTVDEKHKLLVDFKVIQNPNDLGQLAPMALRAKKLFGGKEFEILADKGYYEAKGLRKCVDNDITPYSTKQAQANRTGNKDFYIDKFTYDKKENVYICPAGKKLYLYRQRKEKGKVIGYQYRNTEACKSCQFKDKCTTSKTSRTIFRSIYQDTLDEIDLNTNMNMDKYKKRQTIVEHPYGTVKRGFGANYFLTKGKASVRAETALSFLSYNMKRAMKIIGVKEILGKLTQRREPVLV